MILSVIKLRKKVKNRTGYYSFGKTPEAQSSTILVNKTKQKRACNGNNENLRGRALLCPASKKKKKKKQLPRNLVPPGVFGKSSSILGANVDIKPFSFPFPQLIITTFPDPPQELEKAS